MSRLLTVMIPTTPARIDTTLPRVVKAFDEQMRGRDDAELLCILDNEMISIGEKLNIMVATAAGKYIACFADDDMPAPDYVEEVVKAAKANPDADVILYDTAYFIANENGEWGDEPDYIIKEGKDYGDRQEKGVLYRNPSDKMAWRRTFRIDCPCINTWETSDTVFARTANDRIKKEARIDKPLYYFYYSPYNTQGKRYREKLDRSGRGNRQKA